MSFMTSRLTVVPRNLTFFFFSPKRRKTPIILHNIRLPGPVLSYFYFLAMLAHRDSIYFSTYIVLKSNVILEYAPTIGI